ncbi:unannotated protein [freshwater metagenome]|uniref:Unannotated protein n=1 Tax=freshwater metagenome TaxID=449393 RepID=A0A6J6BDQ6_9ZZZZ|nr:DUF4191 family protein [Actinomycetota bacterium]MSW15431.1 DUF4191 family protein [Actinomycetota bacterium]MSW99047.1 DUF4191 family protein [Actinomycetota bacterium]MSY82621.1 DUF4191 family protein [Actinomycetota bacterium]MSZ45900.1 DUF4191 family protein [Actinomycetota bacterium]
MALFRRKKKDSPAAGEKSNSQLQTLKDAFALTRKEKPLAIIYMALIFIAVVILGIVLGTVFGHPIYFGIISTPLAFLAAFFFFTRQANSAAFASIEGQIGAGASVLMAIRRGFTTTPAVNVSRNQDMVHRCVGRAGIVLVGEGGQGVNLLLQDEKKKMERFLAGVPVTEVVVGNYSGQVSLKKLQRHLKKLPKKLSNNQVREVRNRLKAVGGLNMPIPKGPMPKGVRMPKR